MEFYRTGLQYIRLGAIDDLSSDFLVCLFVLHQLKWFPCTFDVNIHIYSIMHLLMLSTRGKREPQKSANICTRWHVPFIIQCKVLMSLSYFFVGSFYNVSLYEDQTRLKKVESDRKLCPLENSAVFRLTFEYTISKDLSPVISV